MTGMRSHTPLAVLALAMIAAVLGAGCANDRGAASDTANAPGTAGGGKVTDAADLNGTYRYEITLEEARKADMVDSEDTYPIVDTVRLENGDLEGGCFGVAGGNYKVEGDRVTFHSFEFGDDATVTFSIDDEGNLHLTPVQPMDPGGAFQCFSQVWMNIG